MNSPVPKSWPLLRRKPERKEEKEKCSGINDKEKDARLHIVPPEKGRKKP